MNKLDKFQEYENALLQCNSDDDDEDDTPLIDEDTCTLQELEQSFKIKYKIADETAVSLKKDYVLNLCKDGAFTRIAAGLSNATVQIFDINEQRSLRHAQVDVISAPVSKRSDLSVCGVHFLDETPNCLLVGTTNGLVRLFDLRTNSQKEVANFEIKAEKPYVIENVRCFDRNANGRVLCIGTEMHQDTVHLIFFDVRERTQMGGYFESHEDDVLALRFHATNPDLLCTGGDDGLINVFDIKEPTEDDALQLTINTESTVQKLNWHKNVYEKDIISCITLTSFKVYDAEEGSLIADFEREAITTAAKRKNVANLNLVSAHNAADDGVFLLAGSVFKKGEIMRSLQLQGKTLQPLADFDGNKQIVRESLFDPSSNAIVTGGESGIVSLWTAHSTDDTATLSSSASKLKLKTKLKSNKKTPY